MKWVAVSTGVPGRIVLPSVKEKGVVFVRGDFTAPDVMTTRLLLGGDQPIKVWLNGKVVYDGTPGSVAPTSRRRGRCSQGHESTLHSRGVSGGQSSFVRGFSIRSARFATRKRKRNKRPQLFLEAAR